MKLSLRVYQLKKPKKSQKQLSIFPYEAFFESARAKKQQPVIVVNFQSSLMKLSLRGLGYTPQIIASITFQSSLMKLSLRDENKILLLFGEPHTFQSSLMKLSLREKERYEFDEGFYKLSIFPYEAFFERIRCRSKR